jgi:hypothetical protein
LLVELAERFEPRPRADRERRQADQEQGQRIPADNTSAAEPQRGDREDRDPGGLKYGALLSRWLAAQATPDYPGDAGKSGRAADHAIEDTDCAVCYGPGAGRRSKARADQIVEATAIGRSLRHP